MTNQPQQELAPNTPPPTQYSVSYRSIAVILICLLLGLVIGLYVNISKEGNATTLTPMELVGFALSILIGGASLVLAIVAISLGKLSEQALTDRGDEHLRLQTEIYTKTTEALQKIAASTDVTEKRIEDMIQGRASDISQDVMKSLHEPSRSPEEREEQIRRSIMESMRKEKTTEQRKLEQQKNAKRREVYEAAHKTLLLAFANQPHTKIIKIFEHGNPKREGQGIFDGLYSRKKETIAISTFNPGIPDDYVTEFTIKAMAEIQQGKIAALIIVLFESSEFDAATEPVQKILDLMPTNISERVVTITTTYEDAADKIKAVDIDVKPAIELASPETETKKIAE